MKPSRALYMISGAIFSAAAITQQPVVCVPAAAALIGAILFDLNEL